MDANLALRWMSETGAGSIRVLRQKLEWLARTAGLQADRKASGLWVRDVSALGHAEADWDRDRWAVAPPVIARLPAADATAVIAGSRRTALLDRLEKTPLSVFSAPTQPAPGTFPAPDTLLVQFDSYRELRDAAAQAGVGYAGCAAARLAQRLVPVQLGGEAAPPAMSNAELQRLGEGGGKVHFIPARGDTDGLYRLVLPGRARYLYRLGGIWRHCDLATGVFTDLARCGQPVIRWRPERGNGRHDVGTVLVDWGAPLPPLQARTLVLCSGLPPQFSATAKTAIYGNVPSVIADAVARSVHQRVERA